MAFHLNAPISDELYDYLATKRDNHWAPLETNNGRDLSFALPHASYRATQLVPDIQHMLDTFPHLILSGQQDFQIDGDFYRLVITNNEINLLEGHLVYK